MKNFSKITVALFIATVAVSPILAKPVVGKAWATKCVDGTNSSSTVSLGMAICGCINHGGSVEYPKFNCSGSTNNSGNSTHNTDKKQ